MNNADIISNLEEQFSNVEECICDLNGSNNCILDLLSSNVLIYWHKINIGLLALYENNKQKKTKDILNIVQLTLQYDSLKKQIDDIFELEIISPAFIYLNRYQRGESHNAFCEEDEIRKYKENVFSCYEQLANSENNESLKEYYDIREEDVLIEDPWSDNTYQEHHYYFQGESKSWKGLFTIYNAISVHQSIWQIISSYKDDYILHQYNISIDDVKKVCIADYRNYCKELQKYIKRDLIYQVRYHQENRAVPPSNIEWSYMIKTEDESFRLAILGELSKSADRRFEYLDKQKRTDMEKYPELLQKILSVSTDGELFDFNYAQEHHINIYKHITPDNYELFMELVLRRDLIQCEMFPKLKEEYDSFLKNLPPSRNEERNTPSTGSQHNVFSFLFNQEKLAQVEKTPEQLLARLHELIDNAAPSVQGRTICKARADNYLTELPSNELFSNEFNGGELLLPNKFEGIQKYYRHWDIIEGKELIKVHSITIF